MRNFNSASTGVEFSHTCSLPGIPTEVAVSALGMVMSSYGVKHELVVDPTMDISLLTPGSDTDRINLNNTATFFEFQCLMQTYSREFTTTVASLQIYNGVYLFKFKCW